MKILFKLILIILLNGEENLKFWISLKNAKKKNPSY